MKDKKSIGRFLFRNSVVIVLIALVIFFIARFICNTISEILIFKYLNWEYIGSEKTYTYPFDRMNTKSIEAVGGWIEILDENRRVIFVRGTKRDQIYQYDQNQLFDDAAILHRDTGRYPFIYNIYPVKGPAGKDYLFIIKLPKLLYHVSITANFWAVFSHPNRLHIIAWVAISGCFLILFLAGMYIYSKFLAKHIRKPLGYLMDGIKEMEKQNYRFRLNFYAEREFAWIRDAFNEMITRLEKAESEKRRLEESKQRMLVDISHDLKTPITSICGFSKLLHDGEIDAAKDREKYVTYIYNKAHYVAGLVDDLFELSKLEDENFQFAYSRNNLAEWLRQLVGEIYPEFERKKFILDIDIEEKPIMVDFDPIQMTRAVNNLLYNVLKHNPEQTRVRIRCRREESQAVLQIADNGIGIPAELRDIIFDPFVRGDEEGSAKDGTGLGLAIAKKIIQRHNGTIILSSAEEAVTIFTIGLPLADLRLH